MKVLPIKLCICVLCFSICIFIISWGHCALFPQYNLEMVQVLFRHGQRTAQRNEVALLTNTSRSINEIWGYGQLTNVGKQQVYKLGEMLRRRYANFLGEWYNHHDVYPCSSDIDRTKESLQLVLAALFPPTGNHIWNENLKWMPFPIHFVPIKLDMFFNSLRCSELKKLREQIMNSTSVKNLLKQHEKIFKLIEKESPSTELNVETMFYLNNLLIIQEAFNIAQPKWYTSEVAIQLKAAARLHLEINCHTPQLTRLNNGLLKEIVENMNIFGKKPNSHKIYLYSGHEFNLFALAKAHNITFEEIPGYGSAIIIEKYRDINNKIFVKVYLKEGESEQLQSIRLFNCEDYCFIDDYIKLINDSLPSNDDMRCLYKNLTSTDLENFLLHLSEKL